MLLTTSRLIRQTWFANALLLLLGTAGCRQDSIFKKTLEIPGQSWAYSDTLKFDFDIPDTSQAYSLLLDVRHASDYGFQNLYVQMHTRFPSGRLEKQLLSLELAAGSGRWNGTCSGRWCTLEIPLLPKVNFREPGRYSLSVEQFMRQNPLPGLQSMTLKIKRLQ